MAKASRITSNFGEYTSDNLALASVPTVAQAVTQKCDFLTYQLRRRKCIYSRQHFVATMRLEVVGVLQRAVLCICNQRASHKA